MSLLSYYTATRIYLFRVISPWYTCTFTSCIACLNFNSCHDFYTSRNSIHERNIRSLQFLGSVTLLWSRFWDSLVGIYCSWAESPFRVPPLTILLVVGCFNFSGIILAVNLLKNLFLKISDLVSISYFEF